MQAVLDPDTVLDSLESIRAAKPLAETHVLWSLLLLQDRLRALSDIRGPHIRFEVLTQFLRECLLDYLGHDRASSPQPLLDLQNDYQSTNTYRQGYSLLYYRYLRPDLDLSMEDIADRVNFVARTLQRRQADGLEWLTQDLIRREMDFRRHYQTRKLYAQLPIPQERPYFSPSNWLERAKEALQQGRPLLLVGPPQSGKTHAASQCLAAMIPQLDELVTVNLAPQHSLEAQLAARFGLNQDPSLAWAQKLALYLQHHRVGLLLEGLEAEHLPGLQGLHLPFAALVATSSQVLRHWPGLLFSLEALDLSQMSQFFATSRGDLDPALLSEAYEMSGGWPGHLLAYLQLRRLFPPPLSFQRGRLATYYREVWEQAPARARRLWLLMATLGAGRCFFPKAEEAESLAWLTEKGVLASPPRPQGYQVLPLAAQACPPPATQGALVYEALLELLSLPETPADLALCLEVLSRGWFAALGPPERGQVLISLSLALDSESPWELWGDFLGLARPLTEVSPYWDLWYELEDHRQKRHRGHLHQAGLGLLELVQMAGQQGFFELQALAALERAGIALYEQDWELAWNLAELAKRYYWRQMGGTKKARQAQKIAWQALVYMDAPGLLKTEGEAMQEHSAWELLSLAQQQAGHLSLALAYARQFAEGLPQEGPVYGRALCRMAQLLWEMGNWREALNFQLAGLNHLSLSSDMIGQARAQNNLGVIYYGLKQPAQARAAWEAALNLLLPLQDALALGVIQANLDLLNGPQGAAQMY
jgi:hypothetical protein